MTNCNAMAHIPLPGINTDSGRREVEEFLEKTLSSSSPTTTTEPESKTTRAYTEAAESLVRSVLTSPTKASGYYVAIPVYAHAGPSGRLVPIASGGSERYFGIALLLTRPLSRGSVHLSPGQPGKLAINPNCLTHPLDIEILARHVRFLESTLIRTEPLAGRLKGEGGRTAPPGWPRGFSADLEQVRRFLRETAVASTLYTSTCSMMPREMGGVVDERLRVYGTCNVRVVDASVMPFITRGDTMATVYAIAEKAADMIKQGL
jgi:choline dehydrogenase-like flavoprotein